MLSCGFGGNVCSPTAHPWFLPEPSSRSLPEGRAAGERDARKCHDGRNTMTESQERGATDGRGGREVSSDLIDDALKLVGNLQRKLITAGVKRGVGAAT